MSASLVGSEMCIRDRSLQAVPEAPDGCILRHVPCRFRIRRQNRGLGAVSYTHLTLPTICSV
eukprot:7298629-Alexandrium_andersonii.AAC.1